MRIFANTKILGVESLPEDISVILHDFKYKNGKYSKRRENVMLKSLNALGYLKQKGHCQNKTGNKRLLNQHII